MSLWQNIELSSGFGAYLPWVMALFCVISALLAIFLPMHRTRVRAAMILFMLSFLGLFVTSLLPNADPNRELPAHQWGSIVSVFLIAAAVVTLADLVIFDVCLSPLELNPPAILSDLILAVAYVATALFTLSHHSVPVTGIITTSAVLTAVIGFSLQDTLANIMGGMSLQLERTITVGDWIRVNDNVGVVKEIRWRQTSIETSKWDTVVIPNSVLTKSSVVVLGHKTDKPQQHRQYVRFNVDYRYPPTEVIAAVKAAVAGDPVANVASEPPPDCLLMDFDSSYATYAVRYFLTDMWQDEETDSLMRSLAVFALKRQGITMAIPAFRNFQTEEDQARRQRIEGENLDRRLAALSMVDLFHPLTADERKYLAQRLRECPFAAGEVMARQGDESACLYIITKGQAEVHLAVGGSSHLRTLATLKPGEFFGEMGLMTGDKRSASVVALSDMHCLRLDKEDFMEVLYQRPVIAEHISEILVSRRGELNAARDHLAGEAVKERLKNAQGDLLARIRKFFTLER